MSLLVVFRGDVPREWRELGIEGVEVASAKSGVGDISGKFVVVVGDRELAERLGVAYFTEEEAAEFLSFLKSYVSSYRK
ncbi:MAG: hypothetical protein ACPL3C_04105 [Pyrobaculum sp.]